MEWPEMVPIEAEGVFVPGTSLMISLTRFKKERPLRSWISPELSWKA